MLYYSREERDRLAAWWEVSTLSVCYVLFKFYNLAGSSGPGLPRRTATNMWKWAGILRLCCELHNDLPPPPPPPPYHHYLTRHRHHHHQLDCHCVTRQCWSWPANLVILTTGAPTPKSWKAGGEILLMRMVEILAVTHCMQCNPRVKRGGRVWDIMINIVLCVVIRGLERGDWCWQCSHSHGVCLCCSPLWLGLTVVHSLCYLPRSHLARPAHTQSCPVWDLSTNRQTNNHN